MKKLMGIAAAAGFALAGPATVAVADTDDFQVKGTVPVVCNMSIPSSNYDLALGNNTGTGNEGGFYLTFDCNVPFNVAMSGTGVLTGSNACGGSGSFPYEATMFPTSTMGGGNLVVNSGQNSDNDDYNATFATSSGQAQLDVDVNGAPNQCAGEYTDQIEVVLTPAPTS